MCEYCQKGIIMRDEYTGGKAYIENTDASSVKFLYYDNSGDEYGEGRIEINYCPMCGRKLSEV